MTTMTTRCRHSQPFFLPLHISYPVSVPPLLLDCCQYRTFDLVMSYYTNTCSLCCLYYHSCCVDEVNPHSSAFKSQGCLLLTKVRNEEPWVVEQRWKSSVSGMFASTQVVPMFSHLTTIFCHILSNDNTSSTSSAYVLLFKQNNVRLDSLLPRTTERLVYGCLGQFFTLYVVPRKPFPVERRDLVGVITSIAVYGQSHKLGLSVKESTIVGFQKLDYAVAPRSALRPLPPRYASSHTFRGCRLVNIAY